MWSESVAAWAMGSLRDTACIYVEATRPRARDALDGLALVWLLEDTNQLKAWL